MTLQIPGICGWFDTGPSSLQSDALNQAVAAQPWHSPFTPVTGRQFALAAPGGATWSDETGLATCVVGTPYWKPGRFAHKANDPNMAATIATAYREGGEEIIGELGGEFALALFDARTSEGLVAVDRFARRPVYWAQLGRRIVFGGTADSVLAHPGVSAELDPQGLFNYLFLHMVPAPGTIYLGVRKLRAASMLRFRDGDAETRRYWIPEFVEGPDLIATSAGKRFLELVEQEIHREQGGRLDIGAFLSGGLDSSTVAGVFARTRKEPDAYSIGFDAEGYDEIAYARIAAKRFGLRGHEYYVTPDDVITTLPDVVGAYDEPFGNSSALPAYYCARFAKQDGKNALLAGDGGDEIFAGNARYLKQQVFEHYSRVPALLRRGLLEPLVFGVPEKLPLISKARSYITQARVPLPDRLQSYNFLLRLGAEAVVHPDLLAAIDPGIPLQLEREIYDAPANASTLNRMLYLDWHHTLADNDLRKVTRMCELAGIEVSYPLLDDSIVDFSMTIPSSQKIRADRLRDFYKQSVKDFLPGEIIDKKKHGFGLPFGVWTANHPGLMDLVQDNLTRLRRRCIVRDDFLTQALHLHQHGHAAYYGELIWVLTVLELWLTSRGMEP